MRAKDIDLYLTTGQITLTRVPEDKLCEILKDAMSLTDGLEAIVSVQDENPLLFEVIIQDIGEYTEIPVTLEPFIKRFFRR
jgi:hypothetical protein